MTETLWVDPASLSDAGGSVAALGDGLVSALVTLTAGYDANTGQDAAGTAFGFAYQDSAGAVVEAVATGVNALRRVGYLVQGSATNYSRAEAAADIGGRTAPLPPPSMPGEYSAPGGDPDVNGPGQSPPVLWYLVEFLVGDWWPNGSPGELRRAAGAWDAVATPLYHVTGQNADAYAAIAAQQIPERDSMQAAVRDIGTAMSSLAGECQSLANELDQFATDVENTQNAIRDLLDTLKSVVSAGIVGTVFELLTGDAEEKIREVASDIKTVIDNHKRQSQARKELIAKLKDNIKIYTRGMQIVVRRELVEYFGEGTGNVLANIADAGNDIGVGLTLGGVSAVEGLALGFDPLGDPQGTWDTVKGLGKMLLTLNPMTMPTAFAMDPGGTVEIFKDVSHFDDIFTNDRPFIGVGGLAFDIGTAVVPAGGLTKAGTAAKVADEAAQAGRVGRAGEVAGRVAEITPTTRNLGDFSRTADGVTDNLDDIATKPVDPLSPAPGRPVPVPKVPEPLPPQPVTRDPVPPPAQRPEVPHGTPVGSAPRGEMPGTAPAPAPPAALPAEASAVRPSSAPAAAHGSPPAPALSPSSAPVSGSALAAPSSAPHSVAPEGPGVGHGPAEGNRHDLNDADGGHGKPDDISPNEIPPLLVRDTPYETGGIDPLFVGEQYPDGHFEFMGSPGVTYLDEMSRQEYRITIRDGLVYDADGLRFDTDEGVSAFGPDSSGRAIFVMDEHGNLYASTYQAMGDFHHSSFFAGGDVAAAGELVVKDGKIVMITDHSGHYQPGRLRTQQILDQLESQGVDMTQLHVDLLAPEGS